MSLFESCMPMPSSTLCVTLASIFPPLEKKKKKIESENCLLTLSDKTTFVQNTWKGVQICRNYAFVMV